ncbi:hypothetical protein SMATCC274_15090 [Serratia marcescens]|nr:hypothetical protein SMATCC274_15090 [Serratia marcescens]
MQKRYGIQENAYLDKSDAEIREQPRTQGNNVSYALNKFYEKDRHLQDTEKNEYQNIRHPELPDCSPT